MAKKNLWAALVTLKDGDVRRVYRKANGGWTTHKDKGVSGRFRGIRKLSIRNWAKRNGWKVEFTRKSNPFLVYDTDTKPVKAALAKGLNAVGEDIGRKLFVGEGRRTNYQQWVFRMAYLTGKGNLAARCCLKYWPDRWHSWADCGKQSQSNHATGDAADTMILPGYVNIGSWHSAVDSMKRHGLGLPVGGEAWHVELSKSFAGLW